MGRSQEGNRLDVLEKSLEVWLGVVFRYQCRFLHTRTPKLCATKIRLHVEALLAPSIGGQIVEEVGGMIDQAIRRRHTSTHDVRIITQVKNRACVKRAGRRSSGHDLS